MNAALHLRTASPIPECSACRVVELSSSTMADTAGPEVHMLMPFASRRYKARESGVLRTCA